jgi:hypothetical protein
VARLIRAATEPVAGSGPAVLGPVGSGFVAMKLAPGGDQPDRRDRVLLAPEHAVHVHQP